MYTLLLSGALLFGATTDSLDTRIIEARMNLDTIFGGPVEAINAFSAKTLTDNAKIYRIVLKDMELIDSYNSWTFELYDVRPDDIKIHDDLFRIYIEYHRLKDVPLVKDMYEPYVGLDERYIRELIAFNDKFNTNIEKKIGWYTDWDNMYYIVLKENGICRKNWYNILIITTCKNNPYQRRLAYKELQETLKEDFGSEELPPFVPDWRFNEIDKKGNIINRK